MLLLRVIGFYNKYSALKGRATTHLILNVLAWVVIGIAVLGLLAGQFMAFCIMMGCYWLGYGVACLFD